MSVALVPHPVMVVFAARAGAQDQAPRPTLFVDFGEQNPFSLSCVSGWSEGIERRGVGEGTRWFISVPRSSLPYHWFKSNDYGRILSDNGYIKDKRMVCLSYRSEFEVIRNSCVPQQLAYCGARSTESKRSPSCWAVNSLPSRLATSFPCRSKIT